MRLLLSLLLLAAIPVVQAQTPDDAWATLGRCAESVQAAASDAESELESGELRGLDEFEAHCPQLKAALQELGIEESITESSRESFTVVQLVGLQKLAKWYGEPADEDSETGAIDTDALPVAIALAPDFATASALPASQALNRTTGFPGT